MAAKLDITSDAGMTSALNTAYADYETKGDVKVAITRSTMIGRGIAIRNLRLREEQFRRNREPRRGSRTQKATPSK